MKLSIITINYNNSSGLRDTIQSIISQSYADFEYLVIDGNSTDGSKEIIEEYSDKINYWVSEPDSGIYNAMNKGIKKATGDYLLFINSGDTLYDNEVLAKVFINNPDQDLVYGDLYRIFPDGKTDIAAMPDHVDINHMFVATLCHPVTFIKRNLFQEYGLYREDLKIVSDWAFFFKLIVFGRVSQLHLPIVITAFKMDGISSTSENQKIIVAETQKVIKESFSYELLDIYEKHSKYYNFYNKKIFKIGRKIRNVINCIIHKEDRENYIYNHRINALISLINKTVRNQKKDPLTIPVIIINYNRLSDLKTLINFLLERKHKNIVIVDNASTYPPLLEYYNEMEKIVTIERMEDNYGHLVFWKNENLYNKYAKGYHIITDADIIPNKNLPKDYIKQLIDILDKNRDVTKVGFALKIDDIPDYFQQKLKVLDWEKKHWENPMGNDLYRNELDTTFAIYPPHYTYDLLNFYFAIRVAGDFIAQHNGWYIDNQNLTEEEEYYFKTASDSNSWKIDIKND
ncbi:MAG: glycosyltransferase [Prevotella sp.]|jgi:glycosyltransferase involved in cell wall biosynthesis|nr:glycosyltransferase [Prevotella sp.]